MHFLYQRFDELFFFLKFLTAFYLIFTLFQTQNRLKAKQFTGKLLKTTLPFPNFLFLFSEKRKFLWKEKLFPIIKFKTLVKVRNHLKKEISKIFYQIDFSTFILLLKLFCNLIKFFFLFQNSPTKLYFLFLFNLIIFNSTWVHFLIYFSFGSP